MKKTAESKAESKAEEKMKEKNWSIHSYVSYYKNWICLYRNKNSFIHSYLRSVLTYKMLGLFFHERYEIPELVSVSDKQ